MTARRAGCAPIFLPKVHAAAKLATQVRIPSPAPQAPHFTGRGVRGTPRAQEEDPLPRRLTRPPRPLPLHGTFSTEDWALASPRRRNGPPLRWPTGRQVGWICAAAQGIEVKDRRQVPAEPGGQVQAETGKTLCGKALRVRPSVRTHADERTVPRKLD